MIKNRMLNRKRFSDEQILEQLNTISSNSSCSNISCNGCIMNNDNGCVIQDIRSHNSKRKRIVKTYYEEEIQKIDINKKIKEFILDFGGVKEFVSNRSSLSDKIINELDTYFVSNGTNTCKNVGHSCFDVCYFHTMKHLDKNKRVCLMNQAKEKNKTYVLTEIIKRLSNKTLTLDDVNAILNEETKKEWLNGSN